MFTIPPPNTPTTTTTTPAHQRRQNIGLIIFVVIFFLLTIHDEPDETTSTPTNSAHNGSPQDKLKQRLEQQLENSPNTHPHNLSGYFSGNWSFGANLSHVSHTTPATNNATLLEDIDVGVVVGVPKTLTDDTDETQSSNRIFDDFTTQQGTFVFRITKTSTSPQTSSIVEVQGSLRFVDGYNTDDWTLKSWSATCRGLYFPGTGKLTMFTNSWNYNLYLREQHVPGTVVNVILRNDTLIVAADDIMNGIVQNSTNSGSSKKNSGKRAPSCVARLDMFVSSPTQPVEIDTLTHATSSLPSAASVQLPLPSTSSPSSISFDGTITTPLNCHVGRDINVHANGNYIDFEYLYETGRWYGIIACLLTVVQIVAHLRLLKASMNSIVAQSISPISMLMLAGFDATECLIHGAICLLFDGLFSWFVLVALLKFVLFSIMELKFVLKILHARDPSTIRSFADKGRINARFYCALLLVCALLYRSFSALKMVLLITLSFIGPQLVDNATQDTPRNALLQQQRYYLVGQATRLFLPLYIWLTGASLLTLFPIPSGPTLSLSADPLYAMMLVIWSMAQMFLLLTTVQRSDARWYFPVQCLPKIFDYRRDVPAEVSLSWSGSDVEENGEDGPICAVCFMAVDTSESVPEHRKYMLTPCNHLYHDVCLTTWFESGSLTCPVCRNSCPPERNRHTGHAGRSRSVVPAPDNNTEGTH
jgi:hypothetical protein